MTGAHVPYGSREGQTRPASNPALAVLSYRLGGASQAPGGAQRATSAKAAAKIPAKAIAMAGACTL